MISPTVSQNRWFTLRLTVIWKVMLLLLSVGCYISFMFFYHNYTTERFHFNVPCNLPERPTSWMNATSSSTSTRYSTITSFTSSSSTASSAEKTYSEEQLILSTSAPDSSNKYYVQTSKGGTCWSHKTYGPPLDHNNVSWELSPAQCAGTQTIWGGSGMNLQRASEQLYQCANGRGLKVLVVGGSITTGFAKVSLRDSRYAGEEGAWPRQLEKFLNVEYPCPAAVTNATTPSPHNHEETLRHVVINRAERSVGSNHWLEYFLNARNDHDHILHSVDVIILETASNDFQAWHKGESEVTQYVELVTRTLRTLHQHPLFLWATVGWRNSRDMTHGDVEEQHVHVMKYYDVPHVSMLGAFMSVEGDSAIRDFLDTVYFADIRSHMTLFAHKLTASVIGTRLGHQLNPNFGPLSTGPDQRVWFSGKSDVPPYKLPRAIGLGDKRGRNRGNPTWLKELEMVDNLSVSAHIINFNDGDSPLSFPLKNSTRITSSDKIYTTRTKDLIVENKGWNFEEDVKGKPGLIAREVGSRLILMLPVIGHGVFYIGAMSSYERMGKMRVTFYYQEADVGGGGGVEEMDSCNAAAKTFVATNKGNLSEKVRLWKALNIDTLWTNQISVKDSTSVVLPVPHNAPCAWVEFEILDAKRIHNKVKLLDITIM